MGYGPKGCAAQQVHGSIRNGRVQQKRDRARASEQDGNRPERVKARDKCSYSSRRLLLGDWAIQLSRAREKYGHSKDFEHRASASTATLSTAITFTDVQHANKAIHGPKYNTQTQRKHSKVAGRCSACKQGNDAGQSTMLKHGNASTVMTQAKADSRSSAYAYGKNAGRGRCSTCKQGESADQSPILRRSASTLRSQADVQHGNKAKPQIKVPFAPAKHSNIEHSEGADRYVKTSVARMHGEGRCPNIAKVTSSAARA